jgi:hypothetical protein
MSNDFDSNFTRKLARVFLEKFESTRVMSKNVNTQLLSGRFAPDTGDTVDFKRPTDYISRRTSNGDVSSGASKSDIITGKASGVVQDYFTVFVDFDEADEAIKMDQLDQLLAPMATRIKTDLELDFAEFMMKNAGLTSGTPGTAVTTWSDVANAGAVMQSAGIPQDSDWIYSVNPFTQVALADLNRALGAGGVAGEEVKTANQRAMIARNFAGMNVMTATTLPSYTGFASADRAGTTTSAPTATYVAAKDSMTQSIAVTAFGANTVVSAGEQLTATGVNQLNLSTRQPMRTAAGALIPWVGTVTADVTLGASGEGTLVVTGPAIFEAAGQYNTVDAAIANGNVVTLSTGNAVVAQPNLFWHKQAFAIGSVPIKKLYSTDTLATTEDGLQFRISKGAGFLENLQQVRFDFRPAYAALNPFFAGQGFG